MLRSFVLAAAVVASPVTASETLFADRTAFTAALSTSVTDDYEAATYGGFSVRTDAQMTAVVGETSYASTGFLPFQINIVSSGRYCAGCNGSFTLGFAGTSVTQGNGVFGVGFDFVNTGDFYSPDEPLYSALVTFGDGATQLYSLGQVVDPQTSFFGITSSRQIASIAFGPDGQPSNVGNFEIDNLTIGSAGRAGVVPEPAAWALMILGFGLVGTMARRRTRLLA